MFGYKRIISGYDKFIFISPHFDDAILSCGQLILDLIKNKKKVFLITVFTKTSSKTVTPQAIEFLKQSNSDDANKLFRERENENKRVSKYLNIASINLDFIDAAWRLDQNKKPLYANKEKQFSGKLSAKDNKTIQSIKEAILDNLNKIENNNSNALILGPLSIGGHSDHIVIKKVIDSLKLPKLYWEDFPYNKNKQKLTLFLSKNKKYQHYFNIFRFRFAEKKRLILFYKSQIESLFPGDNILLSTEKYYIRKS